jgi:2,3-bisphosphoglycerate-independent phosphoglycerate mutase
MISSPKVATYDLDPYLTRNISADNRKMSVHPVADKTVEILETGKYPFVILNFANPDMVIPRDVFTANERVGHTGVYDAAVEACGHCDQAIGTVYEACKKLGYVLFVTADHG